MSAICLLVVDGAVLAIIAGGVVGLWDKDAGCISQLDVRLHKSSKGCILRMSVLSIVNKTQLGYKTGLFEGLLLVIVAIPAMTSRYAA